MRATLERILGGSPVAVVLKLLVLSLLIGAVMAGFGITPSSIPRRLLGAIRSVADLGFDAVRDVGRYVLTGRSWSCRSGSSSDCCAAAARTAPPSASRSRSP